MNLGQASPLDYDRLLEEKIEITSRQFNALGVNEIKTFPSSPSHFRMRAEFKIWHEEDVAHYAMYSPGQYKKPIKIREFSIGSKKIESLMPELINQINEVEKLKRKLFQVEFLTSTIDDAVITLIYHKQLDDSWIETATELASKLECSIIGRSRGQKLVVGRDFVNEKFDVDGQEYLYQQVETGFTQPNANVCQAMLNWAYQQAAKLEGDLVELYCGNGNFTLPLSKQFRRVLATEVSKTSVNSALVNIKNNNVDNIDIVRMSSEEFSQALNNEREFRRLKNIDLGSYSFSTIFVDPPRAGLDEATLELTQRFENIIYISCNPETLHNNLSVLTNSHDITAFALFDQFPYTEHRECGAILKRK